MAITSYNNSAAHQYVKMIQSGTYTISYVAKMAKVSNYNNSAAHQYVKMIQSGTYTISYVAKMAKVSKQTLYTDRRR